tara:strand:- start:273 stop:590 length:318 start_codon:yes stop_codon:yes gene_type:complete
MTTKSHTLRHVHIAAVSGACLLRLPALLRSWLPDGRVIGCEWVARNPTRADRRAGSFKVNMATGRWADFATNDKGGDLVSLYAYLNGLSQVAAARELIASWGVNA